MGKNWIFGMCVVMALAAPGVAAPLSADAWLGEGSPARLSGSERAWPGPAIGQDRQDAPEGPHAGPAYLAGLARMAFQSNRDGNWEIYLADGSGGNTVRFTQNTVDDIKPRLNRGASRLVFVSNRDGNPEIYAANVDGSDIRRMTDSITEDTDPAWSPDSSKIAFASSRDGQAEIYVMNADGSALRRLTNDEAADSQPAWSPDGARIAFISNRAGPAGTGGRVWVMNADGSEPRMVSTSPWSADPAWSPDGERIAYAGRGDGDQWLDAMVMGSNGENPFIIQHGHFGNSIEWQVNAFSPDGRFVGLTWWDYVGTTGGYVLEGNVIWYISLSGSDPSYQITYAALNRSMDTQAIYIIPPTTMVQPLPAVSPADFNVAWTGSPAASPAPTFTYQVQARQGITGSWTTFATAAWDSPNTQTFRGVGGQNYYFRSRGVDLLGNAEPWPADPDAWTLVESEPPVSQLRASAAQQPATQLLLQWSAIDMGGSLIAGYDLEYRIEPATAWTRLFTRTVLTSTVMPVDPIHAYHFRVRAIDAAGNVEPWPSANGDSAAFPPIQDVTGRIHDAAGVFVTGGAVVVRAADRSSASSSAADGTFLAHIMPAGLGVSITVSKDGYGPVPSTEYNVIRDTWSDYYLPPLDNIVANWGFEAPLSAAAWFSDGVSEPRADARSRHTGALGVSVGGPRYAQPVNVSRSSTDSAPPALAAGPDGRLSAAWIERNGDFAEARYAWRASNGEWSDSVVLFGNLTPASLVLPADYRPELALDAAGAAHILWRTWPQGNVYYGTQPVGGSWSLYLVAAGLDDGSLPRMAVDPSGNAHLTWQSGNGSRRDIFALRRGADGNWSAIETITAQDPYLVDARNPVIAVDITGTAYLAWENGAGFFAWRPVGGEWSAPSPILAWPFNLSRPQLAVDAGGIAHVAWQAAKTGQPNAIAYARFRSGLVSQPVVVYTDTASITLKRLVIDAVGAPHLAWTSGDAAVFHGTPNTGGGWAITRLSTLAMWTNGVIDLAPAAAGVWAAWSADDPARIFEGGCAQWTSAGGWKDFGGCGAPWRATPALGVGSDGQIHLAFSPRDDDQRDVWHLSWPDAPVGPSRISQRLTLPVTLTSPGLSFLYRIDGSATDAQAAFTVTVETDLGSTTVFTSLETPGTPWQHVWRDMSAFAGQSITLTFAIDPRDGSGGARLALDEVSLGSTAPDLWVESALPAEIRPETAQTMTLQYGNRGGGLAAGAVITLTLPPGLVFDSAEPPPSSAAPELVWQLPSILPGAIGPSIVLTLSIEPAAAGATLTPTIVIDSTTPELELANNAWRAAVFVGYRAHLPLIRAP